MRTLPCLLALALVLAVAGCGDTKGAAPTSSSARTDQDGLGQIATEEVTTGTGGETFEGADAADFRTARSVCRIFSVEELAGRLEVPANAYAESAYPPERRQAPYEGCLAGLAKG